MIVLIEGMKEIYKVVLRRTKHPRGIYAKNHIFQLPSTTQKFLPFTSLAGLREVLGFQFNKVKIIKLRAIECAVNLA